jgi:hypothetical protein
VKNGKSGRTEKGARQRAPRGSKESFGVPSASELQSAGYLRREGTVIFAFTDPCYRDKQTPYRASELPVRVMKTTYQPWGATLGSVDIRGYKVQTHIGEEIGSSRACIFEPDDKDLNRVQDKLERRGHITVIVDLASLYPNRDVREPGIVARMMQQIAALVG